MSKLDRERREMAAVLRQPGVGPDPKMRITRRTFIHRSCLTGAATVAQTFAWWPLINTIDIAYAADQPFKFAWISDTHLYPESVNTRFVEKVKRAASEVQAMNPPADFLIFGGDLAQLGRANELALGVQLLSVVKTKKVFIPGEHDWYYDMGAEWRKHFDKPSWSMDHKGVRFIGLDTVSHAPDYWSAKKMSPEERMDHMANSRRQRRRPVGRRGSRGPRLALKDIKRLGQVQAGRHLHPQSTLRVLPALELLGT